MHVQTPSHLHQQDQRLASRCRESRPAQYRSNGRVAVVRGDVHYPAFDHWRLVVLQPLDTASVVNSQEESPSFGTGKRDHLSGEIFRVWRNDGAIAESQLLEFSQRVLASPKASLKLFHACRHAAQPNCSRRGTSSWRFGGLPAAVRGSA